MARHDLFDTLLTETFLRHSYVAKKQTANYIAKKVGCSNVTVLNYLRRYNISIRQGSSAQILDDRYSKEQFDLYAAIYLTGKAGTSIQAIAKRFHLDHRKLSLEFKKRGIFIPPKIYQLAILNRVHAAQKKKNRIKTKSSIYAEICSFKAFRSLVDSLSRIIAKPKAGLVKDHKLSLHDAYYLRYRKQPSIFEIAHPCNIEYMPAWKNSKKSYRSSITLKELRLAIANYNAVYGDPFECAQLTVLRRKVLKVQASGTATWVS